MKLLLHLCCAVCLAAPIKKLKKEGLNVTGYFYNPNIHPLLEFRKRVTALKVLCEGEPLETIYESDYGLDEYLAKVDFRGSDRCGDCYSLRLERTAQFAKENRFDAFTSTLLFSRHQDHEKIKLLGTEIGTNAGVSFAYFDYRYLADESRDIAGKRRIYRQAYCGCIFSENERYKDTTRNLYKKGIND